MNEVRTRRGDTWEKLRLAIGSPKPWVGRSLRPWAVKIAPKAKEVMFRWRSTVKSVDIRTFNNAAIFILVGQLQGNLEVHVGNFGGELRCCEKGATEWVFTLTTTWITFADPEGAEGIYRVPTTLFIEAMRLLRRRVPNLLSYSIHVPKGRARSNVRRNRKAERKDERERRGHHQRWTNLIKFVRIVQASMRENKDVKHVQIGPDGQIIDSGVEVLQ